MRNQNFNQKMKKNSFYKPLGLAIVFAVMIMFISISMVSATTSTFLKNEEKSIGQTNYGTIKVNQYAWYDLFKWGKSEPVAELTLEDNTEICSDDCLAIINITNLQPNKLIDEVTFQRDFGEGNGFVDYSGFTNWKVSIYDKESNMWIPYDWSKDDYEGTYQVKLEGGKKSSTILDWKISSNGITTNEWASWGGVQFVGDEYQLIGIADNITGTSGDIVATQLSTKNWKINTTNPDDEISRALIMKWITVDGGYANVTNPTAVFSRDIRDKDKRIIVAYGYNVVGTGINTLTGTFTNTATNTYVSSWSNVSVGVGYSQWEIPSNTTINEQSGAGTSDELGTDTSGDDTDNPADCQIESQYVGSGLVIIMSNGAINWVNSGFDSYTTADSYSDYDFPKMQYTNAQITLDSPEDNYLSYSSNVLLTGTANITGGAYLTNMSLWAGNKNTSVTEDTSGNHNNGIVVNATWSSTDGHDGSHDYLFNGYSYIKMSNSNSLNLSSGMTLSVWVKMDNATSNGFIISKWVGLDGSSTMKSYGMRIDGTHPRMFLTNTTGATYYSKTFTDLNLTEGTWYYLTATWDGTTMKMYLDGTPSGQTNTMTGTLPQTEIPTVIGTSFNVDGSLMNSFDGSIDDVRIYNRALSEEEIGNLYTETSPTTDGLSLKMYFDSFWGASEEEWGVKDSINFINISDILNITSDTTMNGKYYYKEIYVQSGVTLQCPAGGYLDLFASDNIVIEGTISCSGTGIGTSGGTSQNGYSSGSSDDCCGGGGGGGNGGSGGTGGHGAFSYRCNDDGGTGGGVQENNLILYPNTGGGTGGKDTGAGSGNDGGVGGVGGYGIKLQSNNITIHGTLNSNGNNGQSLTSCSSSYQVCGGGGGGAGGAIVLNGNYVDISSTSFNAIGGSGGTSSVYGSSGSNEAGGGGGGGGGRIKIVYDTSLTNTSTSYNVNGGGSGGCSHYLGSCVSAGAGGTGTYTITNDDYSLFDNQSATISFPLTIDGTTQWNIQACDSDGDCGFAMYDKTLMLDDSKPSITINNGNGTQDYWSLTQNYSINFTITDVNLDACWIKYNGTTEIISCTSGVPIDYNFTLQEGIYSMNIYSNDTLNNSQSELVEWNYKVFETLRTYNTTSYETAYESYIINATANSSLTAVQLNYNGTLYSMTESSGIWSYSRDLPSSVVGNNSIDFRFTYAGDTINSDYSTNQEVLQANFTICDGTYSTPFLNISFKDESDLSVINATVPYSFFEYYYGTGTETKNYSLISNDLNYNYTFCASPDRTIYATQYIQYKQGTSYPQRIWNPSLQTYSSTTTNQVLYLLNSINGIYVTFQVVNTAGQQINDVELKAEREISGSDVIVGQGITGDDGTVTLWLNPDFIHTFTFTKTGYTEYITSLAPTQSSYTITLGATSSGSTSGLNKQIYKTISPTNSSLIDNTEYDFTFKLVSDYWDIDSYGFSLRYSNGTSVNGGSTSTEGNTITFTANTSNSSKMYMDYYWIIGGNYTRDTFTWNVFNDDNTQWSISTFFTDLNLYMDSGLFGLDNFGRLLIIFIVIFISMGVISYKYGLTSPLSVIALMFFVIFFFDVGVGIIPSLVSLNGYAVPHLLTFILGLLFILIIFRELSK
jgi:hypothetical protein